jgi:glycosyltransferase involved in cell wall biosynthesis
MRILLLNWRDSTHPAAGGAEVWAHKVAEGLVSLGHQVTFFSASVAGVPIEELVNGVHVIRRGSRFGVYREARKFFRANSRNFDVILEEINTRPFFANSWGSVPVVPMIHQVAKDVWKYEAPFPVSLIGRYFFEPRWLRKLSNTHVMTLSPSSAESLVEYGIKDSVVVLPGSDDEIVLKSPKNSVPTLVFLGRLVPSKRPDHVIEAFGILKKAFPTAELWMMGSGQMLEKIQKERLEGVYLFGHVSFEERQMRLAAAHVLVATTVREGWGLNVSEASAVGTPTIGYDVPGLRDSIPMSGGCIVPVSPRILGETLIRFFSHELVLDPKIATQLWSHVCNQIEYELKSAVQHFQRDEHP